MLNIKMMSLLVLGCGKRVNPGYESVSGFQNII
jgi:hypothetical protein